MKLLVDYSLKIQLCLIVTFYHFVEYITPKCKFKQIFNDDQTKEC